MNRALVAAIGIGLGGWLASGGPSEAAFNGNINLVGTVASGTFIPAFNVGDTASATGSVSGVPTTAFEHTFRFTTDADPPFSGGGAVGSATPNLLVNTVVIADIDNLRYILYKESDGDPSGTGTVPPYVATPGTVMLGSLVAATTYIFRVRGEVAAAATGNLGVYSGNIFITPIPAAGLLFGTALAGLAWVRRRRQQDDGSAVSVAA